MLGDSVCVQDVCTVGESAPSVLSPGGTKDEEVRYFCSLGPRSRTDGWRESGSVHVPERGHRSVREVRTRRARFFGGRSVLPVLPQSSTGRCLFRDSSHGNRPGEPLRIHDGACPSRYSTRVGELPSLDSRARSFSPPATDRHDPRRSRWRCVGGRVSGPRGGATSASSASASRGSVIGIRYLGNRRGQFGNRQDKSVLASRW